MPECCLFFQVCPQIRLVGWLIGRLVSQSCLIDSILLHKNVKNLLSLLISFYLLLKSTGTMLISSIYRGTLSWLTGLTGICGKERIRTSLSRLTVVAIWAIKESVFWVNTFLPYIKYLDIVSNCMVRQIIRFETFQKTSIPPCSHLHLSAPIGAWN